MKKTNIIKEFIAVFKGRQFVLGAIVSVVFAVSVGHAESVSNRNVMSLLPPQGDDVIAEWHQQTVNRTVIPSLAPVQQTRMMAIVQVAVHDAVNGITGEYETYLSRHPAPVGASPEAAAIAASYHALKSLFGQSMALDNLFLTSLAVHGLSVNDPGVNYGITAATRILSTRANDGSAFAQFNYTAPGSGEPGVWVPLTSAPALLAGWGNITPWVIRSGSQFRPEAPPALNSEQYAKDYNEIKEVGAINSQTRTAEQTQIATFWLGSPVAIWSQPLSQLNVTQNFSLSERARIFALVYLASADSSVACWEAKYFYNYWRPQPAIRRGDEDGNDSTIADQTWTPLFTTPRHPEYPSGHTTNSTAMATILQEAFGNDPSEPIVSTITSITRQWDTFNQGLDEVIDARIYSGLHFRTADEVGSRQGRQVARFVLTHALRPCRGRGARCS
jgi:hypothetical protein